MVRKSTWNDLFLIQTHQSQCSFYAVAVSAFGTEKSVQQNKKYEYGNNDNFPKIWQKAELIITAHEFKKLHGELGFVSLYLI